LAAPILRHDRGLDPSKRLWNEPVEKVRGMWKKLKKQTRVEEFLC